MSLKMNFPHLHLDFFPEKYGAVCIKHEELFHQYISSKEKRYQRKRKCAMIPDYCWILARDVPNVEYKRQAKRKIIHDFVCVK